MSRSFATPPGTAGAGKKKQSGKKESDDEEVSPELGARAKSQYRGLGARANDASQDRAGLCRYEQADRSVVGKVEALCALLVWSAQRGGEIPLAGSESCRRCIQRREPGRMSRQLQEHLWRSGALGRMLYQVAQQDSKHDGPELGGVQADSRRRSIH